MRGVVAGLQTLLVALSTFASLEASGATGTTLALAALLGNLRAGVALVATGSGNDGSGTSMSIPACLTAAFSVGAVWDSAAGSMTILGCTDNSATDLVAYFSNSSRRGPEHSRGIARA